jgi:hypothetical protein
MESLVKSTAHVLLLVAATTSHSVELIGTLTQCMNHLVHLRIVTTFNFSEPPNAVSTYPYYTYPFFVFLTSSVFTVLFHLYFQRTKIAT